ncbi:cytochrome P450 [Streptomyces sp. NPDC007088]|uniref:cytochrome P450 n=1 Tax=Streptomyces sp. NPDC007088 TaxID=3364773 RepID=UPI0036AB45BF
MNRHENTGGDANREYGAASGREVPPRGVPAPGLPETPRTPPSADAPPSCPFSGLSGADASAGARPGAGSAPETVTETRTVSGARTSGSRTVSEEEVVDWRVEHLDGLETDPVIAASLTCPGMQKVRLPYGEEPAWLAGRYADVTRVTSDPRFSRTALLGRSVTRLAPHAIPLRDAVGFADPPEHSRLRRSAAAAFTARRVDRLEPRAQELIDSMLDALACAGPPADLMEHVTTPFALAGISELMGIPEEDWPRMARWTGLIISSRQGRETSERAKTEIEEYFARLAARRERAPGEDLLSQLLGAEEAGGISREEAIAFAVLMQISGMNAVRLNSSTLMYVLLTRPELAGRLREDPGLVPRAVEELLRWMPHRNAVGMARIAVEDVNVGGVRVRAGEPVHSSYLAANRDPEVFARPDEIDLDRAPNPHLAFGHGPHYCVGAALARLELRVLVRAVLERFPRLRLAVEPSKVRWRRGELIRGPVALPVAW